MMGVDPYELREMMDAAFPVEAFPPNVHAAIRRSRVKALRRRVIARIANVIYYSSLVLLGGWFLAQAIDRAPPVDTAYTLLTPIVRPGEEIKFAVKSVKHRACELTLSWVISANHEVKPFSYDPIPPTASKPITDAPIMGFELWRDAGLGDGHIRITRSYVCPGNYLHRWNPIVATSEIYNFTIVSR